MSKKLIHETKLYFCNSSENYSVLLLVCLYWSLTFEHFHVFRWMFLQKPWPLQGAKLKTNIYYIFSGGYIFSDCKLKFSHLKSIRFLYGPFVSFVHLVSLIFSINFIPIVNLFMFLSFRMDESVPGDRVSI